MKPAPPRYEVPPPTSRSSGTRPLVRHVPPRADVYRRVREQVDADTLDDLRCYLSLLGRAIGRGRYEVAKRIVDGMRDGLCPTELSPSGDEHGASDPPRRDRR